MAVINFDCTFLDTNFIDIGSCALIDPNCKLICTNHSINPNERLKDVFNNKLINIGNIVWFGANVTILPGASIEGNKRDWCRFSCDKKYSKKCFSNW